jgi:hypothetical protein
MTKHLQVFISLTFLLAFCASGVCGERRTQASAKLFKKLDADGDGSISSKEFQRALRKQDKKPRREPNCCGQSKPASRIPRRPTGKPKAAIWIYPEKPDQIVDVDNFGNIEIEVDSTHIPDIGDCDNEEVDQAELMMFAKIYLPGQTMPNAGDCPPRDATPLDEDSGSWTGLIPGAPSSDVYDTSEPTGLPQMTLVVWEVVLYYNGSGDLIDECEQCLPYSSITLWGHDPLDD